MLRGSPEFLQEQKKRQQRLTVLQQRFTDPDQFVATVMNEVFGYTMTWMQGDAVKYIKEQDGNIMIQMPRGEGKTLITAILAVFILIHDPSARIVIFSGNDTVASEISKFIYDLFQNWEILQFMCPDSRLGDKSSQDGFSVCGYLRGVDKSPSVRCRPIFGGFQGIRADVIIGDDLEMLSNSQTAEQRGKLRTYIQELESLLDGTRDYQRIILLGTPQSTDSVYNSLPSLGFNIRIWTARVPSVEDIHFYGDHLAPSIQEMYDQRPAWRAGYGLEGNRGKPTDPDRYDEELLIKKEVTQSGGMFDLQYMLCTKLADKDRYPLKLDQLLFMEMHEEQAPAAINPIRSIDRLIRIPQGFSVPTAKLYHVLGHSSEVADYEKTVMYIDPSGGGSKSRDEVGVAVVKALSGNVYVKKVIGLEGGYSNDNMELLSNMIGEEWSQCTALEVICEDNYGNGMFRTMLQSTLRNKGISLEVTGVKVSGQKELRIIDTFAPLLNSNKLIFNVSLLEEDIATTANYSHHERQSFSLFHQIRYITRDRGSLKHDDRIDALAGALQQFTENLVVDQHEREEQILRDVKIEMIEAKFSPEIAEVMLDVTGLKPKKTQQRSVHTRYGHFKGRNKHGTKEENKVYKSIYEQRKEDYKQERRKRLNSSGGNAGSFTSSFRRRKRR